MYDGQWINGLKDGNGKWWGINGDSYEGNFKLGKIDGQGIYINS